VLKGNDIQTLLFESTKMSRFKTYRREGVLGELAQIASFFDVLFHHEKYYIGS